MDKESIKKALEDNANYEHHNKLSYIDGYKCKTVDYADILTLINELESENKRLKIQLAQANAGIVNCSGCKFVEINAVCQCRVNEWCGSRNPQLLLVDYEVADSVAFIF